MRNLPTVLILLFVSSFPLSGQITYKTTLNPRQSVSKERITSGLYPLSTDSESNIIFSGSTTHFSEVTFRFETLLRKNGEQQLRLAEEQILIIKEGKATVKTSQETKTIGPNSVFFLLPGDEGSITSESSSTSYYRMVYTANNPPIQQENNQDITSFIIDYGELEFHESGKGGTHRYFNRSTSMCPYYEMHVTTLNPNIQSHPPHRHEAAEIILIIQGETEEEIDGKTYRGKPGDTYFLPSNSLHAIRNIGNKPCQYFAFQWGASK